MPKYQVQVPEIHYQTVIVNASSREEAIREIMDGEGERLQDCLEFSCIDEESLDNMLLDIEHFDWAVVEIDPDMCQECESEEATTARYVEYEEVNLCETCAEDSESDE